MRNNFEDIKSEYEIFVEYLCHTHNFLDELITDLKKFVEVSKQEDSDNKDNVYWEKNLEILGEIFEKVDCSIKDIDKINIPEHKN